MGGDEIASVPCVSIANHPDEKKYQKKKGGGTNTHLRATDISVLAKGGLRKLIGRPLSRFKRKWQLDLAHDPFGLGEDFDDLLVVADVVP